MPDSRGWRGVASCLASGTDGRVRHRRVPEKRYALGFGPIVLQFGLPVFTTRLCVADPIWPIRPSLELFRLPLRRSLGRLGLLPAERMRGRVQCPVDTRRSLARRYRADNTRCERAFGATPGLLGSGESLQHAAQLLDAVAVGRPVASSLRLYGLLVELGGPCGVRGSSCTICLNVVRWPRRLRRLA